ncbi:MAG: hypothetical protein Q8L48_37700 [Archangium sp.]|nr:hypothetical protein [Archangium sp.]
MRTFGLLSMMSCLALTARADALTPGTLRWTLATGGGSAERVFFVLEGAPASPRQVTERWTLEVSVPGADGLTPVRWTVRARGAKPTVTDFVVWEEGGTFVFRPADQPAEAALPVVQRELPPRPLSMERVPCSSQLLPGGEGVCAAVAGGPLSAPFFPLSIVVSQGGVDKALLSFAVMVMTAGIVIPGNEDTSVVATLDPASPPARLPPLLAKWRNGPRTVAALATLGANAQLDAETAGALLVLSPVSPALVEALTLRVPPGDRWSMLRLARQRRLTTPAFVSVVTRLTTAGMLGAAPADDAAGRALEASALVGIDGTLRAGLDGLLAGRFASLRALGGRAGTPAFEAPALEALEKASLEPGEGGAIAALVPVAARRRAAPRFLERLPDDEAIAVMAELLDGVTPGAAVAQLERVPRWVDKQVATGHGKALLDAVPFDEQRARVLSGTLTRAPEAARPALLVEALRLLVFDDGRALFLRKWHGLLPKLTPAQRQVVLETFSGSEERLSALKSLVANLDAPAAKPLVLFVARGDSATSNRVAALRVRPGLTLDAAEAGDLLTSATFDSDRVVVAQALLEMTPEDAQPALLVDAVRRMTFDGGRLDMLRAVPTVVKRLDGGQRAAVLAAFDFDKTEATALLGP